MNNQCPVYYSGEVVRRVLSWPMVTEAVEASLKAVSQPTNPSPPEAPADSTKSFVCQPARSMTMVCNDPSKLLLTMPAFVGNYQLTCGGAGGDATNLPRSTLACKLVTSFSSNQQLQPPLPNILANIMLFNVKTGELEAIMAGRDITTWRTVAASLIATKYLYFRRFGPTSEDHMSVNVAIIGCGTQGQFHAEGMVANFKVKTLSLYNRTESRTVQVANELREWLFTHPNNYYGNVMPNIKACATAHEAVQDADIICTATYSPEALIRAADLPAERSVHINAVGAGEVHYGEVAADIYAESLIYVDSLETARHELVGLPGVIVDELGAVIINGNYPNEQAVTIFQSMGMASEDACVAEAVQAALFSSDK